MRVLLCLAFTLGAFIGVPMDPEKIRELLEQLTKPKVAETLPKHIDDGDDPEAHLRRRGLNRGE